MAPKLTSCDVFGMLVKYWLSSEGAFAGLLSSLVAIAVTGGIMGMWCCDCMLRCGP